MAMVNAQVLFMQGGASAQFAAVPLNLTRQGQKVDQLVTGSWSKKAGEEAGKYSEVNIAAKVGQYSGRTCSCCCSSFNLTLCRRSCYMGNIPDDVRRPLQSDNKSIPEESSWELSADAVYVHYCDNETIQVSPPASSRSAICQLALF